MATMNVSLPDPMREWVDAQVKGGEYANASDYIRDLIRQGRSIVLTEAGGVIAARSGAREPRRRSPANRRAAGPDSAPKEYEGRAKTAMGTARKTSRQRFQRGICTRMSAPISQTNRTPGKRPASAARVSAV